MLKYTYTIIIIVLVQSCSYLPSLPSVEDIDAFLPDAHQDSLKQGSVISNKSVDKLQLEMTKQEVLTLLGSPSIIDPFHNNEWNYINNSFFPPGENVYFRLRLVFKGDSLKEIDKSKLGSIPDEDILIKGSKIEAEINTNSWYEFW